MSDPTATSGFDRVADLLDELRPLLLTVDDKELKQWAYDLLVEAISGLPDAPTRRWAQQETRLLLFGKTTLEHYSKKAA